MAAGARLVRRTAAVPLTAGLLLLTAACTTADPGTTGSKPRGASGSQSASTAPPGRFRTLPEPCGAVPRSVLARLLPGIGSSSPSPGSSAGTDDADGGNGSGKPSLTYDTDRRVGCSWTGGTAAWSRYLHVDFERVVSYDPAVSDEEQAKEKYLDAAGAAGVPPGGAGPGASVPGSASGAGPSPGAPEKADPSGGSSSGTASPRIIAGVGDEAFLEDRLKADAAEPHREVVIVFRRANAIVKVELREWPAQGGPLPSGSAMQVNAHLVAQKLAEEFGER